MKRSQPIPVTLDTKSKKALADIAETIKSGRDLGEKIKSNVRLQPSRWDRWSGRAAMWSQVLMLVVVTFGYFATVRPVFQKEQLSEDVARLQVVQRAQEKQVANFKDEVEKRQDEIAGLENQRSKLEVNLADIRIHKDQAEQQAKSAIQSASDARKKTEVATASLKRAIDLAFDQRKNEITGQIPIRQELVSYANQENEFDIFKVDKSERIAERLKLIFSQPSDIVIERLNQINERLRSDDTDLDRTVDRRIAVEYEKGISLYQNALRCSVPDFAAWQVAFIRATKFSSEKVNVCVTHHVAKHRENEKWSPSDFDQVKKTDFWSKQMQIYRSSCEAMATYEVENVFREKWRAEMEPCRDRLFSIDAVVLGQKQIDRLKPLSTVDPPSIENMELEITRVIETW